MYLCAINAPVLSRNLRVYLFAPPHLFSLVVRNSFMTIGNFLFILLCLLLVGALPVWSYSASWGYWSSGGLSVLLFLLSALIVRRWLRIGPGQSPS